MLISIKFVFQVFLLSNYSQSSLYYYISKIYFLLYFSFQIHFIDLVQFSFIPYVLPIHQKFPAHQSRTPLTLNFCNIWIPKLAYAFSSIPVIVIFQPIVSSCNGFLYVLIHQRFLPANFHHKLA